MKKIILFLWLNLLIGYFVFQKVKPVEIVRIKEVVKEIEVLKEVNKEFKEIRLEKESEGNFMIVFDGKWNVNPYGNHALEARKVNL